MAARERTSAAAWSSMDQRGMVGGVRRAGGWNLSSVRISRLDSGDGSLGGGEAHKCASLRAVTAINGSERRTRGVGNGGKAVSPQRRSRAHLAGSRATTHHEDLFNFAMLCEDLQGSSGRQRMSARRSRTCNPRKDAATFRLGFDPDGSARGVREQSSAFTSARARAREGSVERVVGPGG